MADILAVFRYFRRDDRSGADKTHLALQDIEQLRQLVDAGLTHRPAERCDARVALEFLRLFPFPGGLAVRREVALKRLIRVDQHRAEFEAIKRRPVKPD